MRPIVSMEVRVRVGSWLSTFRSSLWTWQDACSVAWLVKWLIAWTIRTEFDMEGRRPLPRIRACSHRTLVAVPRLQAPTDPSRPTTSKRPVKGCSDGHASSCSHTVDHGVCCRHVAAPRLTASSQG